jgi:uncharacterized protein
MTFEPAVWVLDDGKAGMASQAIGLAEAAGFPFIEKHLEIRLPWSRLSPRFWLWPFQAAGPAGARLAPPRPDLVIARGCDAAIPALAIRRTNGGPSIAAQIQDPEIGHKEFDLFVVPVHDRLQGPRVLVTRAAVHRATPARLAARCQFAALAALPRPILSVLIGATNKAYRLTLRRVDEIADALVPVLRRDGGSLALTTSRRTGEAGPALLRERLANSPAVIWDGTGENPYFVYLAVADALLVTADSISIISEAAATGKPVHILKPDGGNAKFARFRAAMRATGITRPFCGRIESRAYPVPDDTARAGAFLGAVVLRWLERRPS